MENPKLVVRAYRLKRIRLEIAALPAGEHKDRIHRMMHDMDWDWDEGLSRVIEVIEHAKRVIELEREQKVIQNIIDRQNQQGETGEDRC